MKARIGFVSNSSSSSFVVKRSHLNQRQAEAILGIKEDWTILEETIDGVEYIRGHTMMDNFGIEFFMDSIGARNVVLIETDNWADGDEVYAKFASKVGEDIGHEDFWRTYGDRELDWKQIARRLMAIVQHTAKELRDDIPHHPASLLLTAESYDIQNWQFVHKRMKNKDSFNSGTEVDDFGMAEEFDRVQKDNPDMTSQDVSNQVREEKISEKIREERKKLPNAWEDDSEDE